MAVLEAMALGKPCLVTPGTNLATFIDESDAGWTTDMDSDSIADSLIKIIRSSSEVLKSKGVRAQKLLRERFLLPRTVENLRALYRDAIVKNTRRAEQGIHS